MSIRIIRRGRRRTKSAAVALELKAGECALVQVKTEKPESANAHAEATKAAVVLSDAIGECAIMPTTERLSDAIGQCAIMPTTEKLEAARVEGRVHTEATAKAPAAHAYGCTFVLAPALCLKIGREDAVLLAAFAKIEGLAMCVQSDLRPTDRVRELVEAATQPMASPADALLSADALLGADAVRLLGEPNAGGASRVSESMSMEVLSRAFGATLLQTELEIQYWPSQGNPITDFSVTLEGTPLGVSVTRALGPPHAEFDVQAARGLLGQEAQRRLALDRDVPRRVEQADPARLGTNGGRGHGARGGVHHATDGDGLGHGRARHHVHDASVPFHGEDDEEHGACDKDPKGHQGRAAPQHARRERSVRRQPEDRRSASLSLIR
jgi:hypothetical protein